MEKATRILSKIAAIALIVCGAIGVVGGLITAFSGAFSVVILPLIITIAELVIGILLLGACKDLASTKYLVMIIVAVVLIILDRFVLGGASALAAATFALFQSIGLLQFAAILFGYGIIVIMIVAIAALVLKIVMMVRK